MAHTVKADRHPMEGRKTVRVIKEFQKKITGERAMGRQKKMEPNKKRMQKPT